MSAYTDAGSGVHARAPDLKLTAAEFFRLLYPNADDLAGYLNLYTLPGKRSEWFRATDLEQAAERAVELSAAGNVYYGFGLVDLATREQEAREAKIRRGERNPKVDLTYIRGTNTTITAIPGVCHDADILDLKAHKKTNLPTSTGDVLALYEEVFPGKPPTLAIASGRGVHGYWLFQEAYSIETALERDDLSLLLARFQATINDRGKKRHGWALDGTADLAHVFRPTETCNRKGGRPIPVTVLAMSGRRYDLEAFDDELIDVAWMPKGKADPVSLSDQLEAVDDLKALSLSPWTITHIVDGNEETTDDEGKPVNHFKSDSEAVWRVVNELGERGHPDDTIAAILLDPRYGISAKPLRQRNPRAWVAAELGRMRRHQATKPRESRIGIGVNTDDLGEHRNGHVPHASPKAPDDTLPEIVVTNRQLRDITTDALDALEAANEPPTLYVQHGQIVRVRLNERGRPITETMTVKSAGPLRGRMERTANYVQVRTAKDGETVKKIVAPPGDVVTDLLSLTGWPFPPLVGTIEAPALRPDGTIITAPGYDRATGLLYIPASGLVVPPIPDQPSTDQLAAAVRLLADAIGEFPYADQPSRANAFGMLVTPTVRPAIRGNAPLGLINKPRAGSGASLLVETIGRIAAGRPPTTITAPKTEDEMRKRLTAILVEEPTGIVSLDNLEATLASESLASALTAPEWSDRTLGSTAMARVQVRWTPFATGNNVRLGGDLPRRVYECRLDPQVARPWTRTGFRHADLPGWVMEHRGELLAAVLTVARAWYVAGRPPADVPRIGGFDEWAQTIGGILAHAGVEGFLGNLLELWENNDEEANEWEVFLTMWYRVWRDETLTVGTLVGRLQEGKGAIDESLPTSLVDAWAEATAGKAGSFKRRLGKALAKHTDTIFGSYRLENSGKDTTTKLTLWRVRFVGDPDGPGVSSTDGASAPEAPPDKSGSDPTGVPEFPEFSSFDAREKFTGDTAFSSYGSAETNSGNSGNSGDDSTMWGEGGDALTVCSEDGCPNSVDVPGIACDECMAVPR